MSWIFEGRRRVGSAGIASWSYDCMWLKILGIAWLRCVVDPLAVFSPSSSTHTGDGLIETQAENRVTDGQPSNPNIVATGESQARNEP